MKAFKLININTNESSFIEGEVPELCQIKADYFFAQSHIDNYELTMHPAPRYQFVVTLKGRLRFTVTNGNSFIIEPGILLIATDMLGYGHSWEVLDGKEWHRLYIIPAAGTDDCFVARRTS